MKKYFLVFSLVCVLLFSGCSQISYAVQIGKDGTIAETVDVVLDKNQLEEKGINPNLLLDEIENEMKTWANSKQFEKGVTHKIIKNSSELSCRIMLGFEDDEKYRTFWQIEDIKEQKEIEFCFLYDNLIISKSETVFKNAKESSFANHFKTWCNENFGEITWQDSDFKFGFIYGVPSSFNYMSNADSVIEIGDTRYHIWQLSLENADRQVVFFTPIITARNIACGLCVILILTFVFGLVLFLKLRKT